jgi:Leucine-rich repeat (LRR) protein
MAMSALAMVLRNCDTKQVNLNRQGLTELPAEIAKLTNLQILYLNWNALSSLPEEFGAFRSPAPPAAPSRRCY